MQQPSLIDGRFEIREHAGAGGMGVVYRAFDRASETDVALKLLGDMGTAERFERECEALSRLKHPGVVGYIAHGTSDGRCYLAMEWLQGEDLHVRLRRGPLSGRPVASRGRCRDNAAVGFVTERGEGAVVLRIAEVPVAIKLSCETARDAVFRRFEYLQFPWDDRAGEALTPSLRFKEGSVSAVSPAGRADLELGSGVIRGTDDVVLIDALTRVAVAWHLAERDGVLLHASAWLEEGLAQVGFGHSGVGKSTLARSAKRALADELVAIVSRPPGFEVHGTPWWVGCEAAAPLGDLIWLLRGEEPSTRCVRGGSLVPALWEQVRRDDPDPHHLRRIAESCARLAARGAIRVAASEGQVVEAVRNRAAASSRGVGLHVLSRARSA